MTQRNCTVCGEPISAARLKSIPSAMTCAPCLEKAGDVPRYKLHQNGVDTLFLSDPYLEEELDHVNDVGLLSLEVGRDDENEPPQWYPSAAEIEQLMAEDWEESFVPIDRLGNKPTSADL